MENTIEKTKELEVLESIIKLIKDTPNDTELGRKIRTIYNTTNQFQITNTTSVN